MLIFKCIRTTTFSYGLYNTLFRQLKCISQTRCSRQLNAAAYFSNIADNSTDGLSVLQFISNPNAFKIQDIENIFANKKLGITSQEKTVTLLSCGKLLLNRPLDFRIQLCNIIFQKLKLLNNLTIDDYNVFIKVCTENEVNMDIEEFLKSMTCVPSEESFKLLLENVCDKGNINQAQYILSKIKEKKYGMDERVFNALVLAYTINEGEDGINNVLKIMTIAKIPNNSEINWNILIGLAIRHDKHEFLRALDNFNLIFNDDYFIKLLTKLCLNDNYELVENLKTKFSIPHLSRHFINMLKQLCVHLIYRNKTKASVYIYSTLTEYGDNGKFLFKEMLKSETDLNEIISICKYLKDTGKNLHALECITEIALRNNDIDKAWIFLQHFDKLRTHYFWPLLLNSARMDGEIGVMKTVGKMLDMKVDVDTETLEGFVLPYCDISSPKMFLSRVQHLDLSLKQLLTPILIVLLKSGQIRSATQLCCDYEISIDGTSLVRPLALAWKNSKDVKGTLTILKKICEEDDSSKNNILGHLLANILKLCNNKSDFNDFLKLLQALPKENYAITTSAYVNIGNILGGKDDCNIKTDVENALDKLLNVSLQSGASSITHPRDMTIPELECHLIELTNKNMETRGTLRHLILNYARIGNFNRVQELRDLFERNGYIESAGLKASLLQSYTKTKQSVAAMKMYREIRKKHQGFTVDEFKLIDLATLFVEEDKFEIAMELLKEGCRKRTVIRSLQIERNCFNLLNSAKTPDDAVTLFTFLRDRGFCKPANFLLGAIVRSYIKANELDNAVTCYENCCKKYKCTPLQVELLQITITAKNEELLERVLDATTTVFGQKKTEMSLVVALAETGMKNALMKLLLNIDSIRHAELQNRCDKWMRDGKSEPLLILAEAFSKLKSNAVNADIIHTAIFKTFDSKNDWEGALNFMNKLIADDVIVSEQITNIFNNLLKRCQPSSESKINSVH